MDVNFDPHSKVDAPARAEHPGLRRSSFGSNTSWAVRERQLDELAAARAGVTNVVPSETSAWAALDVEAIDALQRALVEAARAQVGCAPHSRTRHVGITAAFDGLPLRDFLRRRYPHVPAARWVEAAARGDLALDGRAVDLGRPVRAGARFEHTEHDFREPEIATDIRVLWADHALWVIDKPAPLPVHPSGRFGHNTFTAIAQRALAKLDPHVLATLEGEHDWAAADAMPDQTAVRPVHRLDADTRGLLIVARSRAAARMLTRQWEDREVAKLYRARVKGDARGIDGWWRGDIGLPSAGRVRQVVSDDANPRAQEAVTYVSVVDSDDDFQTTNLLLSPWSGRTNQLRVHLAAMGSPIVGDDDHEGHTPGPDAPLDPATVASVVTSGRALALVATHLEFTHPFDRRRLRFVLT